MQITVIYNAAAKGAAAIYPTVCDSLRRAGATVVSPACDGGLPSTDTIADALLGSAAAVAIGGDGTIMHVAKAAALADLPVLGINGGHLGFLAGLEREELDSLHRLLTGEYVIEPHILLDVTLHSDRGTDTYLAMNEAVVARGAFSRLLDAHVSIDGHEILTCQGDGVILATPTGSTAYSLSAGGPVVDPAVPCILLTPICSHSLDSRSRLFPADTELAVGARIAAGEEAFLTVDGEANVPLSDADSVTVKRSGLSAKLIRLKSATFYDVLSQKIAGRR